MKYAIIAFCFLGFFQLANAQEKAAKRPNIILILADDLGYTDVGTFAKNITGVPQNQQFYETPSIDKLASQGIAFSQAYACPLCAPTRSSIITGRYAAKLGMMTATGSATTTFYAKGIDPPKGFSPFDELWADSIPIQQALINGYTKVVLNSGQPGDKTNETTISEGLKGYDAAFLGKWHLGGHGAVGYQPRDQGFRELAYFDAGGSPYYNWRPLWNSKKNPYPLSKQKVSARGDAGPETGKDYLTDDLTAQALNYLDERAKSTDGKPFFLDFCEFGVHAPVEAPKELSDYFDKKPTKGWNGHHNPVYAAMIKKLDESVGKVMDKLKETGLDENTIVIFMSDNGGVTWNTHNPGDTTGTTSNTPLKGGKAMVYEGGIRVPLIIWQKGKITEGTWSNVPVDCNDIFPTIMELTSESYDQSLIDGKSLKPLFTDVKNKDKKYDRNTFIWHYPLNVIVKNPLDNQPLTPHSAIREGDYKLIFDWYGRLQLFNIKKDISETNNLAFKKKCRTKKMFGDLVDWLDKNVEKQYLPTVNPNYVAAKEVRKVPFVDLYSAYHQGKNVVKLAH